MAYKSQPIINKGSQGWNSRQDRKWGLKQGPQRNTAEWLVSRLMYNYVSSRQVHLLRGSTTEVGLALLFQLLAIQKMFMDVP